MLAFLSTNWYWFFAAAIVFVIIGMVLQLRNMSKTMASFSSSGMFTRFGFAALFMICGSVSGGAGLIGLVVTLIDYFRR